MGLKKIVIIGGGISGLAALHFLKKRFTDRVSITLYERDERLGGTIRTQIEEGALFEWGPNGFLDNTPGTLELIAELNLSNELIESNIHAQSRFISFNGNLCLVPMDPWNFISTPLLSWTSKWQAIRGLFKKGIDKNQSIYSYASVRFGIQVTERLIDPFISGVFAGDIKRLHMASAFPRFFNRSKTKKAQMQSFKSGMCELIDGLARPYRAHIQANTPISNLKSLEFDHCILAIPSYVSANLLREISPDLSQLLEEVPYAPIAVVGLLFEQSAFAKLPEGFGYLIPSQEAREALGVVIESNIFNGRCGPGHVLMRVMMGGSHNPAIINDGHDELFSKALKEIDRTFGLRKAPVKKFVKMWPKAIPQYELNYPILRQKIAQELLKTPEILLCGNYLDGISFNDCINNAKSIAGQIRF